MSAHKIYFDICKLTNAELYLNSEFYPYGDLNLDFDKRRATISYDMYLRFRASYYQISRERNEPSFQLNSFLKGFTLVTIDKYSWQNESIKSGTMDVRLKFKFKKNVPANTTAYCLIINERVIEYSPMSNVVRKIT